MTKFKFNESVLMLNLRFGVHGDRIITCGRRTGSVLYYTMDFDDNSIATICIKLICSYKTVSFTEDPHGEGR